MQIQRINSQKCFKGKFEINPLFNKFREELSPAQKETYENIIKGIEKESDGTVFKFDRFVNPYESGGAEVGIFERKALINDTYWIPLFCSKRANATWCFDKLRNMYNEIRQLAKK